MYITILFAPGRKIYDKTYIAYLTSYTLSGIMPNHLGGVDISSSYIALYRSYNAGTTIGIDINNLSL